MRLRGLFALAALTAALGGANSPASAIGVGGGGVIPAPPFVVNGSGGGGGGGGSGCCLASADYYVSPSGSDTTGTGTQANPYKTWTKCYAVAIAAGPPKSCGLLSGTYTDTSIEPVTTGNGADPSPIASVTPCNGTCVLFEPVVGATVVVSSTLLKERASHVEISGVSFSGPTSDYNTATQNAIDIWPANDSFSRSQVPDDVVLNSLTAVNNVNVACSTNVGVYSTSIGVNKDVSPFDIQAASGEQWRFQRTGVVTGGTWTATVANPLGAAQTTAAISATATAAQVASAFSALSAIGTGNTSSGGNDFGNTSDATTTLSAAITTTSQTSVSLTSYPANWPQTGNFYILVGSEEMQVTAGQGTTSLTVTRAADGTFASTYNSGQQVSDAPTKVFFNLGYGNITVSGSGLTGGGSVSDNEWQSDCLHNPQFIKITGDTVHDSTTSSPSNHVDCTHIYDVTDIDFEQNLFYGCEHIGIFADSANWTSACCKNLTICDNVFQQSKSGADDLEFGGGPYNSDFTNFKLCNNTVLGVYAFLSNATWPSSARVANNIIYQRYFTCGTGSITFSTNAMPIFDSESGNPTDAPNCTGSGNFRLTAFTSCVTSLGNENATPLATPPNPHLVAASPCHAAATQTYAPTVDLYGTTRANPTSIGAVEG